MSASLFGREREMSHIERLLAVAAGGAGGALALSGAPGSGRTSLLRHAALLAATSGWSVRHAAGRRSEQMIAGATVHELLGEHVVEPVAIADQLRHLSDGGPLLVTVDDLDLADPPSVAAVLYAARRLVGTQIAVLLALGITEGVDLSGVDRIELDGLSAEAVAELFTQVAGPIATEPLVRVMELTAGNPLAVVELARRSTAEQRAGDHPFSDLPEVSEALVLAFAEPLRVLGDPTRRALCVAAAEPTGRLDVIAGALDRLGDSIAALEEAEAGGVIRLVDGRAHFDHPMRRVVAYASLALSSRRAAHRALAAAWSQPDDAIQRVRHLVAGAVGPDDGLADDVQLLAEYLDRVGRQGEALKAWRAAASLSVDATRRRRREERAQREPTVSAGVSSPLAVLSPAERRVAHVVAEGLTNKQAAERLFLSVKTVDAHLQAIFRKLQVNTRAQLAVVVARSTA